MLVEQEHCCTDVSQIEVGYITPCQCFNLRRSSTKVIVLNQKLDNKSNVNYTAHMQQRMENNGHKVYESRGRAFWDFQGMKT